ncbi:MAG: AAA family ATPase, partial [Candidatus Aenigmarchaeota archaeon]|nr:AAA family ATPase [Candidatus Aenigmarchaeota archaeon]
MELLKITIENFKSIDKLEFDIKKYGSSHTSMFVGINETGKSNILQAMSFLELPKEPFEFKELNNRNNTKSESI